MTGFPKQGLYAITQPEHKSLLQVTKEVTAAIKGGAAVIQYRDKQPVDGEKLAIKLLAICKDNNIPLIINDDIDLAASIGADGVHLGRDDEQLSDARKKLAQNAIIGVSCYNDMRQALIAQEQGATYVAFGRFFPSSSKPLAPLAKIDTLHMAKQQLQIPIVAIGGIVPDNGAQLIAAGADFLAAIDGVFAHNPGKSARNYQRLFE
jgi:thiamine-phosphate pyrophosphorylase